jgi:hypothetical protein
VIGAAHQIRQFLDRMRQRRPLGDRPIDIGGAEGRPQMLPCQRQSGWNDQQRHVFGIGLGNAGKGVLNARPGLRREHTVACRRLRSAEAVGHADADPLLPAQDRAECRCGARFDQRIARVAGEEFRALALEDFGNELGAVHGSRS